MAGESQVIRLMGAYKRKLAQFEEYLRQHPESAAEVEAKLQGLKRRVRRKLVQIVKDEKRKGLITDSQIRQMAAILRQFTPAWRTAPAQPQRPHPEKEELALPFGPTPPPTARTEEVLREKSEGQQLEQNIIDMIRTYNSGDRKAFYSYNPIRFGVINTIQRLRPQGSKLSPIIQQANDGELLGIKMEDSYVIVFPMLRMNVGESIYIVGALGEIFECQGYKESKSHEIEEVVKPAIFRGDENRLEWPPIEKGILRLRPINPYPHTTMIQQNTPNVPLFSYEREESEGINIK